MAGFLVVLFFLAVIAAISVPIIITYTRRQQRDQKSYERGLKMVPLLIHLPPMSEDTELGSRDTRDLADENISKAQPLYNILAGTFEKNRQRKIFGQQHFTFEIISAHGFVYFYTTVPVGLVEVVRQAIVSAYPSARLEEAEEHNIFSPVGKASATTGGELVLKESFSYPIATYMDTKRDAMQGILNALATVGKEDGAAIQILMRPADPKWRRRSHELTESKRKGEDNSGSAKAFGFAKDFASAFVKAPEAKDKSDRPELSSLDQAILDSIDDKTRYPAFEVMIRVVASSNMTQRAQMIASQIVSAFSLFDAQGKNGFKYEPAKDIDELVTGYIMKFFPQQNQEMILNSVEMASIFHFPDQRSIPTSQLERQDSKQVDGPRNMPEDGLLLGYNVFRGVKKPIRLAIGDRQRHMYVVGQTGTGKSTFLENLALQDMMSGNGFAFVDPHGDTAEKLLAMVPKERSEDVIYFSPADMEYPMGLNLFEFDNPDQKDFLVQEALNMLYKLYDPQHQGIMGPRYEHLFRNAALTVMADPEGGTFIDIPKLFRDPQYVKQKLQYVKDLNVLEFWQKEMPQSQRSNEFGEVVSWFVSKFGAFLSNEMMRNIIGQTKSAFSLRDIMDNKKILLVNLSKGRTGDLNSKLLGMVFVMKFQAAAMSRANIPEKDRVDFSLYVDEFQNFSTDSFATIMSEARKYHLNLIVANQFTTQLTEEIRDAVFGNMGTIVAFRIGQNDVESLSRYFQPTFDGDDLLRVPNYNSIVRTLVGGVPTQPFSMAALPPLGEPNTKLSEALKQLSHAKYGRPKATVEKEIFERIATKNDPAPAASQSNPFGNQPAASSPFGAPQRRPFANAAASASGAAPASPAASPAPWNRPAPAGTSPFAAPPAAPASFAAASRPVAAPAPANRPATPTGTGSFLDEWLAKRPAAPAAPASAPVPAPVSAPTPAPASEAPLDKPVPAPKTGTTPAAPAEEQPDDFDLVSAANDLHDKHIAATKADALASGPLPEDDHEDDRETPADGQSTPDEARHGHHERQEAAHGQEEDAEKPAHKKRKKHRNKRKKAQAHPDDDLDLNEVLSNEPLRPDAAPAPQPASASRPAAIEEPGTDAADISNFVVPAEAPEDEALAAQQPQVIDHTEFLHPQSSHKHAGPKPRHEHPKPLPHKPLEDTANAGEVTIGNTYDRNLLPSNHVLTEDDFEAEPSPEEDTIQAAPEPAFNDASVPPATAAPQPAAEPQTERITEPAPTPQPSFREARIEPLPPTPPPSLDTLEEPVAETAPEPEVPEPVEEPVNAEKPQQPARDDLDWLPRGGPTPRQGSGPQLAYGGSFDEFEDRQAIDLPAAPTATPPRLARVEGKIPASQEPDEEDEALAEATFKPLQPGERRLSHGDTIYIDKDGHLQEVAAEDVGNPKAS